MLTSRVSFILLLGAMATGCHHSPGSHAGSTDTRHGDHHAEVHVGAINADELLARYPTFRASHEGYQPAPSEIQALAEIPDSAEIEVYFGTWCHDSQRELGRFIKLLERSGRSSSIKVSYHGLSIRKRDASGRAAQLGVRYTPTFIVFQDGRERGRIVESPRTTLGGDLQAMFADP